VIVAFGAVCGVLLLVAQTSQSGLELTDSEELEGKPALRRAHRALMRLERASRALEGQNYGAARVHLERSRRVLTRLIAKNADDVLAHEDPAPSPPVGPGASGRGIQFQPRTSGTETSSQ
jgi:hypothetical protein